RAGRGAAGGGPERRATYGGGRNAERGTGGRRCSAFPLPRSALSPAPSPRLGDDQPRRSLEPQLLRVHDQVVVRDLVAVAAVVGLDVLVALAIRLVHHAPDVRRVRHA